MLRETEVRAARQREELAVQLVVVDLGRWLGEDYRVPGPPALEAVEAALASRGVDED